MMVCSFSLDFSKPLKQFDTDVSYDSVEVFYQDLGFNDVTIEQLRPYFSALENFVHYDVFAIIERFEEDILANENNADKLSIKSQEDFFEVLRLFGFQDEWAQTYTWAMGKAYADQLVKHSIEECIRLRLSPSNTIQPYPDWSSDLENNQWQTYSDLNFRDGNNFFVRNQDRRHLPRFDQNLNDIGFNDLVNLTCANHGNAQYWFHATNWDRAENILRSGAERRGDHTDFSKGPAYYLNNDYRDCYEFLIQRNHIFRGQHAILIYEFDPEQLSNGRYVCLDTNPHANQRRWKQIVFSCISSTVKNEIDDLHKCDCVFGWQCANPNAVRARQANNNTHKTRTCPYDDQYAVQLAIRTNQMLTKVDDHLIGVVIFEHS
ncbi:unnamed protein product [Rotaria sordida]|uniref:Uncharacterized protein n=1 Tax=Rotaria sordida TaxID=392033 RepID=A0A815WBV9_9BILA|nr:unnamed protein product [Rotaria sordida]CAF1543923.1 unnamed protein product [Rotaria sordida]CAF4159010.1 unnamed protein product [Rotaria sordida]CAF4207538.1 unnamed protein product [Rotaria sordida]